LISRAFAVLGISAVVLVPQSLRAQGYRGEARVTGMFLDLQTIVRDSVPESQLPGDELRRRLPDGTIVRCTRGDFCRWYRSGPVQSISVATQELRFSVWPGVQGLSASFDILTRFGTDSFWPRSDQDFTFIKGYLSYDHSKFRARAGRIFANNPLGVYNYDGATFLWRGFRPLRAEVFGGWYLAPNVDAPYTSSVFTNAELIPPEKGGLLFGLRLGVQPGRMFSGDFIYQRVVRTDPVQVYSERLGLSARGIIGKGSIDAGFTYDLSYTEFNNALVRLNYPIIPSLDVSLQARHYLPFFELWSIWGAFSPVGFNEGLASVAWRIPHTGLQLEVGGAYRNYEDTDANVEFANIKDYGWRIFGDLNWSRTVWFGTLAYRADTGFGAVRYGGDLRFGRSFGTGTFLALRGSVTQTFGEFRIGEQYVTGGALEGAYRIGDFSLNGSGGVYRVTNENRPQDQDWTQPRFNFSVSYRFGHEPGVGGSSMMGAYR
jgi:hypothetical protein